MNAVTGKAMSAAWLLIVLATVPGQPPVAKDDAATQEAARAKRERLLEIYTREAAEYTIYRDASRKEKVELRREPVYVWTNPVRGGGQDGVVYVWTCRGRAEVLGSFFSYPGDGAATPVPRVSFALAFGARCRAPGTHAKTWTPQAAGIEIAPIPARLLPANPPRSGSPRCARSLTISPPRPRTSRTALGAAPAASAPLPL